MTAQLVVFDLAGTTVLDPGGVSGCFRDALSVVGLVIAPADADAVMGLPKPEAIARLVATAGRSDLLAQVDAIHADFVTRMTQYYRTDPGVGEVPGAAAVFARLRRAGIRVAVNTGFDRSVTDVLLARLGWSCPGTVDASISSDEVQRGRPAPEMIRRLMAQLDVTDARRVAKVGDTPADLHEGTDAGCGWVIGVTRGTHTREQLERHPHTHLIETVADLPAVLGLGDAGPAPSPVKH